MNRNPSLLLTSMVFENIVCETVRAYSIIKLATQANGGFLSLMVPAVLLIGPVFFGVIAGMATDHLPREWCIYPIYALALVASGAFLGIQDENQAAIWPLLTAVAILSYLSVNIRIAVSKFALRKEEYSKFHAGVVWVLQLAPIVSPLIATSVLTTHIDIKVSFGLLLALSLVGALLFQLVVGQKPEKPTASLKNRLAFSALFESLSAAWRLVVSDDALRRSVIIASLQNILVFVSGTIATSQYQSSGTFSFLGGLPLFVGGCGALLGATVAARFKRRLQASTLLVAALVVSCGAVIVQALASPSIFTLTAVFVVGLDGAITAVCAWDIRLDRSSKENIGSVAGLTGTLYKVPSIVVLPLIAGLGEGLGTSAALLSSVLMVAILFGLSSVFRPAVRYKNS